MPNDGHVFPNMWPVLCVCVDLLSLDQSKTFYKPDWFDIVGSEVKCCKEAVCVIDMSSFTKFELTVSHDPLCYQDILRLHQSVNHSATYMTVSTHREQLSRFSLFSVHVIDPFRGPHFELSWQEKHWFN